MSDEFWAMRFGLSGMLDALSLTPVDWAKFGAFADHAAHHSKQASEGRGPAKRSGQKLLLDAAAWLLIAGDDNFRDQILKGVKRRLRLLDASIDRHFHSKVRP